MGHKISKGNGAAKAVPSLDDQLQMDATDKAVEAMFPILEDLISKHPARAVTTLTRTDLGWLAVAAITGWIHARAEQAKTYDAKAADYIKDIGFD